MPAGFLRKIDRRYKRKNNAPVLFKNYNTVVRRKKQERIRRKMGSKAIPRGLTPSVHFFKRTVEENVNLTDPTSLPLGLVACADGSVAGTFITKLNVMNNVSDFKNLFTQYKITGVAIKIYSMYTTSSTSSAVNRDGEQILVKYKYNRTGKPLGAGDTLVDWLDCQAFKERPLVTSSGRPLKVYNKLMIRSMLTDNTAPLADDYALIYPKWINVNSDDVPHYGMDVRFDSVSGNALHSTVVVPETIPKLLIRTTLYFQCKQVH